MTNSNTENLLPTKFDDLKPTELYRSAIDDFALPVNEADKNKKTVLLAAFVEGGVTWADYVAQHPDVAPAPEPEVVEPLPVEPVLSERIPEKNRGGVITLTPEEPVDVIPGRIRTAELPKYNPNDQVLVKMDRENPLFQTRGYRFTKENPYCLVAAKDAEYIFKYEDGFRPAFPHEVGEYYGEA